MSVDAALRREVCTLLRLGLRHQRRWRKGQGVDQGGVAFRAQVKALRSEVEVHDGWLKVFSRSHARGFGMSIVFVLMFWDTAILKFYKFTGRSQLRF
jgi:hypothetical protein